MNLLISLTIHNHAEGKNIFLKITEVDDWLGVIEREEERS